MTSFNDLLVTEYLNNVLAHALLLDEKIDFLDGNLCINEGVCSMLSLDVQVSWLEKALGIQ